MLGYQYESYGYRAKCRAGTIPGMKACAILCALWESSLNRERFSKTRLMLAFTQQWEFFQMLHNVAYDRNKPKKLIISITLHISMVNICFYRCILRCMRAVIVMAVNDLY